jgi:hypothetical protein
MEYVKVRIYEREGTRMGLTVMLDELIQASWNTGDPIDTTLRNGGWEPWPLHGDKGQVIDKKQPQRAIR